MKSVCDRTVNEKSQKIWKKKKKIRTNIVYLKNSTKFVYLKNVQNLYI